MSRPRVYLLSPFGGDPLMTTYAQRALNDSIMKGESPFACHLLYPQVLDEDAPDGRCLGMALGQSWLEVADTMVVYGDHGISEGMVQEMWGWLTTRFVGEKMPLIEVRFIGKTPIVEEGPSDV